MRALTFMFALLVGLAMAFLAPALAGTQHQSPATMGTAVATEFSAEPTDQLAADLLTDAGFDLAPSLDTAA